MKITLIFILSGLCYKHFEVEKRSDVYGVAVVLDESAPAWKSELDERIKAELHTMSGGHCKRRGKRNEILKYNGQRGDRTQDLRVISTTL